ncbi:UDP-N-acetylmuramoyl-L-alanyl-D-glutamate--2,6-diaminopimelate ligase [Dasania sp. GY-MA-18]|uniref:UDP-N-acetylmuramoyl-L-alanyl-D-glutamate--2,6-diaminopimelate ligase n=1 Tax=Dasania phycosphaerae TaxID=2950436 RepID=A0A9J6RPT7_9GAMM|nr:MULTISPECIES: UDP-N-acetylmuramoyl-L-alanyl-D-glutamate--2,6-diaminopimelate ligase [Dasania]MCR8923693.1 UDP-N-acetylmuramoyl-L-alanyl-D-glutamate--2,6-diaminopimelate ligase [Dasania sp. GY-MA-18]MCZ0866127.1 UDP-N-acetylmuramoyl-L-alanyl-D-glutamate--2,6-diaminopimelate ligase [Dasania phycosphaerae]MCZ0869851.1 UDP-N-acetylmuramoyl-L-alanyl-D-glutamate--2,6-diaminopimelate ligase [Dasania phycosphaerae]
MPPQAMTLQQLLADIAPALDKAVANLEISGLQLDSRAVRTGDVFIACVGATVNGEDFIAQAIQQGAVAVLVDVSSELSACAVPVVAVANLNQRISAIAGNFYGQPSQQHNIIGVTGTNGKTSCSQFVMQLLQHMHKHCGVIGTLGSGIDGHLTAGLNTTPDAISLQKTLADWRTKVDMVAMEVSSHGLEQGRVAAITFDVAVFTNLTRDHLDYHGDMASYGAAKAKLFKQPGLKTAVINRDDAFAEQLIASLAPAVQLVTYSVSSSQADVYATDIQFHAAGISAQLQSPWGSASLNSSLLGHFNLSNILAAIASLAAQGFDFKSLVAAASNLQPVAGRMELINSGGQKPAVVIDYAHTPDALEQALTALRLHAQQKLVCVFGCGGDRDQGKRPLMGEVAARLADQVWITSDNPRTENADVIIQQIVAGAANTDALTIVADRAQAIAQAVLSASDDDVLLIAGKGHEDYQQIGMQRLPFNDAVQARLALAKRAAL